MIGRSPIIKRAFLSHSGDSVTFTPEIVTQIERVNRILVESRDKLFRRVKMLYRQMLQLKAQGDEFLTDFEVEGTFSVEYFEEEPLLERIHPIKCILY